jgi:hypothetical protein
VATALWLTDHDGDGGEAELRTLADTGYATTCFELLKFILRDADGRLAAGDPGRTELLERLRGVWSEINH